MQRSMTKAERLRELERLYFQRAYSDIELGERLGVDRTTVFRDRKELETELPFVQDEEGRWSIDRARYLSSIRVNLPEALSLYLAARRTSQQTRFAQTHVASALEKLALALRQPMTERLVRAADHILVQRQDPMRAEVFETVAAGWIEGRQLRLVYRALGSEHERVHRFAPYLLEPSPWNDGVYLIGRSDLVPQVITLKLERIMEAKLLGPFVPPVEFDEEAMLRHAWGIWGSEQTPQRVKLRFAPGVATRRLRESIWHPLEEVTDLGNGGCEWQAPIAEPQEMLPWIRGWGAQVEVLEPAWLRETLARETKQMTDIYHTDSPKAFPYHTLYAKTACTHDQIHPLLYHLIDVGQVTLQLWQVALSQSMRQWIAGLLCVSDEAAGCFIAFLAALHDLGKAGPAYQRKYSSPALQQRLNQSGFVLVHPSYSSETQSDVPHGTVSTWALSPLLIEMLGLPSRFARAVATAIGGHHGVWPRSGATERLDDRICAAWDQARRDLFWEVRGVFQPPAVHIPAQTTDLNAFLTVLSALTSVADWIGSREDAFPFEERPMPTRQYAETAAQRAKDVVTRLGWAGWQATGDIKSLKEMFPFITAVRPVQQTALETASLLTLPALVILEAPTGLGKTEIALALADTWVQRQQMRGIYVAMPTQATSNQMFERVVEFLSRRYPDSLVNVNLAHGQAAINETLLNLRMSDVGEDEDNRVTAVGWFMEQSKRALLAPFGVGTVDQALLSILQTKHFFVRLFGLHHKVVIFDEVHAYDAYMSTLFDRLLGWLRALGTSVIILSATLPAETRRRLVKAYTGNADLEGNASYPLLTVAAEGEPPRLLALPEPENIALELEWLDDRDHLQLVAYLEQQLRTGGCAAVICNTVRRAQEVYCALRQAALVPDEDLILFHARFPPRWRKTIEIGVLRRFGKPQEERPNERPARAIVVATQVIEQSLDLDFDVMITEQAPIDLLIQRAGRLHRHDRGARRHPRRLVILQPATSDSGLLHFGASAAVYDTYILLQSYLTLQGRTALSLPADTPDLIESVYHVTSPSHPDPVWHNALQDAYKAMHRERNAVENKAKDYLVLPPGNKYLLEQSLRQLEEDDPTVHASFQARTRDIAPGVALIGLFITEHGLALEPDGTNPIDLDAPLSPKTVTLLDQYVLNVQHWAALRHFVEQEPPATWRRQPRLRYCRALVLEPNGYRFSVEQRTYVIRLSRELGLQITQEEA